MVHQDTVLQAVPEKVTLDHIRHLTVPDPRLSMDHLFEAALRSLYSAWVDLVGLAHVKARLSGPHLLTAGAELLIEAPLIKSEHTCFAPILLTRDLLKLAEVHGF